MTLWQQVKGRAKKGRGAADLGGDRAVARVGEVEETNDAVVVVYVDAEDFRAYPPTAAGREWYEQCLVKDRLERSTSTIQLFNARLGWIVF